MDPSVLGTARGVLAKSDSMNRMQHTVPPLPTGCVERNCMAPAVSSCTILGGVAKIDPVVHFLNLQWQPPSGSPADLPLVFTYYGDSGCSTELGTNWALPTTASPSWSLPSTPRPSSSAPRSGATVTTGQAPITPR